ncbi:hypothetical protein LPJ66_008502 [Kickxella alabastrina]|uniref:Uncharacterized protein n=1 Tax=Kickxella alabastrina TaxID=61397 RepID=A0ACC1I9J2_9FUNG|nr:hypothetical protein LPJ66_008502 [Kickxella alabastrina]
MSDHESCVLKSRPNDVAVALVMLYAMASRKDQSLSAPANVIADIVEPTTWNDIMQMVDISGSLEADHTAREQLYLPVCGAVVSKNFP